MSETEFDYKNCTYFNDEHTAKKWLAVLEKYGTENVRARLAALNPASRASIAISIEPSITVGFAEEWLAWKDSSKSARDIARHERQIFWTRWAAISASAAALAAVLGRLITIASRH